MTLDLLESRPRCPRTVTPFEEAFDYESDGEDETFRLATPDPEVEVYLLPSQRRRSRQQSKEQLVRMLSKISEQSEEDVSVKLGPELFDSLAGNWDDEEVFERKDSKHSAAEDKGSMVSTSTMDSTIYGSKAGSSATSVVSMESIVTTASFTASLPKKVWGTSKKSVAKALPERTLGADVVSNAVIFLDWDDTLFPTTFVLEEVALRLSPQAQEGPIHKDMPYYADLQRHSELVESMLRACAAVARVRIVTLATPWWLEKSAQWFMPGVDMPALLQELNIEVLHAERADPGAPAQRAPDANKLAKRKAMRQCLTRDYASTDVRWNVLSIGDSTTERDALQECLRQMPEPDPLCKTIKLGSSPLLRELDKELSSILPFILKVMQHKKDISATPASLNGILRGRWSLL